MLTFENFTSGHNFRVTCLAYDVDGTWMATGSYDRTVVIWHGETGLMRNRISAFGGAVLCLGFLPYGPFVCAGRSVDVYTHTHTYTHIYVYIYMCIYVYTYKYIHMYTGVCVCLHVTLLCLGLLPFGPVGRAGRHIHMITYI